MSFMNSLPPVAHGADQHRLLRRRSRNGCLTCKRRKVRCNEQRPHCYHCRRLNLDCVWEDTGPGPKNAVAGDPPESNVAALDVGGWPSPSAGLFDFALPVTDPTEGFSLFHDIYLPDFGDSIAPRHTSTDPSTDLDAPGSPPAPPQSPPESPVDNVDVEDWLLSHAPILDPVENGPICASVRALIDSMATSSPMVRYSIAAFSAIQFYTAGKKVDYQQYYDKAADELSERFHRSEGSMKVNSSELKYVLTTIFFLTYINVCPFNPVWILVFAFADFSPSF